MENIIDKVKETINVKPSAVICIDGCCASGKTTLAQKLAEYFGAQVIHMDDFFLPPEMRTVERLSQAGGNVHHERFTNEVINGIKSGREFRYHSFCCKDGSLSLSEPIYPDKPIIIEGSYSMHPEIPDIYDLRIFVKTSYNNQLKRIAERNGNDALEVFESKWIPLENKYFEFYNIESKSDIITET